MQYGRREREREGEKKKMTSSPKRKRTTTSSGSKSRRRLPRGGKEEKRRETLPRIGPFRIPNFEEAGTLTARTVAHIAREIVKFLLFNRAQIPLVFDDLVSLRLRKQEDEESEEEDVQAKKRKRKRKKNNNKRSEKKLFDQIARIERAVTESLSEEEFVSRRPVRQVAACFGATANRPVETYVIDLEDVEYCVRGVEEDERESQKKTKSAANRIVRAIMPHVAGLRTSPSRTSQMIWVFLKHEDAATGNDDGDTDDTNVTRVELSERFTMKRNLNSLFEEPNEEEERGTRKNVKGKVYARIVLKSSTKSSPSHRVPSSSSFSSSPPRSWYQSRFVSKGFRFKETAAAASATR